MKPTIMETRADGRQFGWLGTKCPDCNGTGEMNTQHSWAACSQCAGTGEEYGEIPVQEVWQPIDTAPLDTPILVWEPHTKTMVVSSLSGHYARKPYESGDFSAEGFSGPDWEWDFEYRNLCPTHWMPLPPPPPAV